MLSQTMRRARDGLVGWSGVSGITLKKDGTLRLRRNRLLHVTLDICLRGNFHGILQLSDGEGGGNLVYFSLSTRHLAAGRHAQVDVKSSYPSGRKENP